MVSARRYPSASFGKRRPFKPGLVREYELLQADDDFPAAARLALVAAARSFRWTGRPDAAPAAACLALWPVPEAGGVLLIRCRDAGRDDQGRPHLLHADAAFLTQDDAQADPDRLAALLRPEAWPDPSNEPAAGLVLDARLPPQPAVAQALRDAREDNATRWPRLLVCSGTDHSFQPPTPPAVVTLDLGPSAVPARDARECPPRSDPQPTAPRIAGPLPLPVTSSSLPWKVVAGLTVLAALLAGWRAWTAGRDAEDHARLLAQVREQEEAARHNLETARDQVQEFAEARRLADDRHAEEIRQRDLRISELQDKVEDLARQCEVLDKALKVRGRPEETAQFLHQLGTAQGEGRKTRAALDDLRALLARFEKDLHSWRQKHPPASDKTHP